MTQEWLYNVISAVSRKSRQKALKNSWEAPFHLKTNNAVRNKIDGIFGVFDSPLGISQQANKS